MSKEAQSPTAKNSQPTLYEQMEEFERQNPKVAEAMRLFGMSLTEYHGALNAMLGVRITQANSTSPVVTPRDSNG